MSIILNHSPTLKGLQQGPPPADHQLQLIVIPTIEGYSMYYIAPVFFAVCQDWTKKRPTFHLHRYPAALASQRQGDLDRDP